MFLTNEGESAVIENSLDISLLFILWQLIEFDEEQHAIKSLLYEKSTKVKSLISGEQFDKICITVE